MFVFVCTIYVKSIKMASDESLDNYSVEIKIIFKRYLKDTNKLMMS